MRKVFFILAIVFSAFLLLPLTLYAGSNIEIVQVNYSLETNEVAIKGVNLAFFGFPSVSIGDSVLIEVCDYNSDVEIICDISQTLAVGGGSFPLRLSAGNAPHLNAEIDVYIPTSNIVASCVPGDIIMCYSGDPATINIGFCGAGYRVCGNDGTWGDCMNEVTPETEICDYTDNDCDGDIDEDFPLVNNSCLEGIGACQNVGIYICDPDDSNNVVCSVEAGEPTTDTCNGIDDDCDGQIDEDYSVGEPCGVGACAGGVTECSLDGLGTVCPTDYLAGAETCNGVDDDCDGATDEIYDLSSDTSNCGACNYYCPQPPNSYSTCDSGYCGFSCDIGYNNCNQNPSDGCETDINSFENCGGCGQACQSGQACVAGVCTP